MTRVGGAQNPGLMSGRRRVTGSSLPCSAAGWMIQACLERGDVTLQTGVTIKTRAPGANVCKMFHCWGGVGVGHGNQGCARLMSRESNLTRL